MHVTRRLSNAFHLSLLLILLSAPVLMLSGCLAQSSAPKFDAANAFTFLKKQCDFGYRYPGSEAHIKTRDFLAAELRRYSDDVKLQEFEHVLGGKNTRMWNVIAHFPGEADGSGILLCAHWDTRPTADQELEDADKRKPIIGANDGASGVAVLLEMARMFHDRRPPVPVTVILFDGEDYGPTGKDMFLGSSFYADSLNGKSPYRYGILLDMIGDKNLGIYREGYSQENAEFVVDKIWKAAREAGHGDSFVDEVKYTIQDDHVPLIRAGVPCADVIDFDYAHWHTLDDTVDKCSPESLKAVGETIARVVYSELPN